MLLFTATIVKNTREYKRKNTSWLNVQWTEDVDGEFSSDISLELQDGRGVLAEIAAVLSSSDCNIENINMAKHSKEASSDIFTITVRNRKHLARVMRRLRSLPSVYKISRIRN